MRGIWIDLDGNGTLCDFDEEDAVRSAILDNVSRYFVIEKYRLIKLINEGEIEYIEREEDEDEEPEDRFDRARDELTVNTLNWHIESDLEHYRERDERITKADIMEAYLRAAAIYNVQWTVVGKDYGYYDVADNLYAKGFVI